MKKKRTTKKNKRYMIKENYERETVISMEEKERIRDEEIDAMWKHNGMSNILSYQ